MNKNSIDLCVRVKESIYDPKILKEISIDLLEKNNNVKIHLNTKATESIFDKFDKVIICTYANLNELLTMNPLILNMNINLNYVKNQLLNYQTHLKIKVS